MTDQVRPARPDDAGLLTACIRAAYAPYSDLSLPDVSRGVANDIAAHLVWVAEVDGTLAGGIIVSSAGSRAHLRNVAVHPDFSGQGVCSGLIRVAVAHLREDGVQTVELATHIGMPQNVRLYEHLGWTETGRSGDKIIMSRTI